MNIEKETSIAEFENAWRNDAAIRLLGLDKESAEALWNVAFLAGQKTNTALTAEPVAYEVWRVGCRAPDDCEEYSELMLAEEVNDDDKKHARPLIYADQ